MQVFFSFQSAMKMSSSVKVYISVYQERGFMMAGRIAMMVQTKVRNINNNNIEDDGNDEDHDK